VETLLPFAHDPNGAEGRSLLGLLPQDDVTIAPFRVLPGDDTSCLNLYRPQRPRIIAPKPEFLAEGRFGFAASLAGSPEEARNPWLLLDREDDDGAIPVIADANSITYVLHKRVGDTIVLDTVGTEPVQLRLVAALADSVLQGELVMSEKHFLRLFPDREGYQFLLIETPATNQADVAQRIEDRLADFGADAVGTADRLAQFHRVENTYLSTFQTLGGLGLLLGTVGLAAVLLRNILERRRELALLGAVGYAPRRLFLMLLAETTALLVTGLVTGAVCAIVAIAPVAAQRGGALPTGAGIWLLLFAVLATGLLSAWIATRAALHAKLLDALRAD
jgi:hypothetical protein